MGYLIRVGRVCIKLKVLSKRIYKLNSITSMQISVVNRKNKK